MAEGDRTEAATPRRRQEARRQGDVWQPRELGPAAALAVLALVLPLGGGLLWRQLQGFLALALARGGDAGPLPWTAVPLAVPLALAAATAVLAMALPLAAARRVSLAALVPKPGRLDPLAGLKRLGSPTTALAAVTALVKLGAVLALAFWVLGPQLPALATAEGPARVGQALTALVSAAALLLALVALLDAGLTFVQREARLRMTRDEVRREARQNDGAPEVKAAIRRAQLAAASRRLRTTLKDASVVVVNPQHFAVALRYRPDRDAAPVVVEKGRQELAAAIMVVAGEMSLPVLRVPRLARALFFTARVGAPVHEALFPAVATILAFVMRFDAPDAADAGAVPSVPVPPDFDFDESGARRRPGTPLPL